MLTIKHYLNHFFLFSSLLKLTKKKYCVKIVAYITKLHEDVFQIKRGCMSLTADKIST